MAALAYAGIAVAGILGWVTAFRIYGVVRRDGSLGWAPPFIGVTTIVVTLIVLPMAVADRGIAGLALVVGVSGVVALAIAALVWWNAAIARRASDRLDAMLEDDPELATRFRQHWWFKRISRKQ
jgi:hypothetical protein